MFSYRHHYHAGNYADVFKHIVLVALIDSLKRKPGAFAVLDTHAAIGRYDLKASEAQKTGEYVDGIGRLWSERVVPDLIKGYLDTVRAVNDGSRLAVYPGSPRIARQLLREQDRLLLCELNPQDHAVLKQEFAGDAQSAVHLHDAWQALKAFLPPKEKRGLVLIDPAYEQREEYKRLVEGLTLAYKRWPTGMYAIWYPLMSLRQVQELYDSVSKTGIRKILRAELSVAQLTPKMNMCGSGLLIVNPPWQLAEQLRAVLPWLTGKLQQADGAQWRVDWLVEE